MDAPDDLSSIHITIVEAPAASVNRLYAGRYDGERVLAQNLNQAMLGTVAHYAGGFLYFSEVEAFYAPLDQNGKYRPPSRTGHATHGRTPVFQVIGSRVSDIATGHNIGSALNSLDVGE